MGPEHHQTPSTVISASDRAGFTPARSCYGAKANGPRRRRVPELRDKYSKANASMQRLEEAVRAWRASASQGRPNRSTGGDGLRQLVEFVSAKPMGNFLGAPLISDDSPGAERTVDLKLNA
jgi:hypothetical protein